MGTDINSEFDANQDDLFASIAEQLKTPFVQIANAVELMDGSTQSLKNQKVLNTISLASNSALSLIDSYLLNSELSKQETLELEPVPVSSVARNVSYAIEDFAKLHNCEVIIDIRGKYSPALANNRAVYAALTSLSLSFIEAVSSQKQSLITIGVKKNSKGIDVGIFTDTELSKNLLIQARQLKGRVRQPLAELEGSSGAGVFVADELFSKVNSELHVSKHRGLFGLSATLLPSQQLSLV